MIDLIFETIKNNIYTSFFIGLIPIVIIFIFDKTWVCKLGALGFSILLTVFISWFVHSAYLNNPPYLNKEYLIAFIAQYYFLYIVTKLGMWSLDRNSRYNDKYVDWEFLSKAVSKFDSNVLEDAYCISNKLGKKDVDKYCIQSALDKFLK